MALIDSLRNKEGTIVYPKTVTKAIYDYETMQTLEQTIDAKFGTEDVIPVENGGTGNKINESAQSVKLTTPRVIQINLGLEDDETTFDGTEDVTLGITGVLPTSHGGTGNTTGNAPTADKLNTSRTMQVNLASTTAASFDGSANVTIGTTGILPVARGGTGNTTGNAATATKLATARTIQTNLASTTAASFDGSGNISVGVTGTLPVANGGTGATSAANAIRVLGGDSVFINRGTADGNSDDGDGLDDINTLTKCGVAMTSRSAVANSPSFFSAASRKLVVCFTTAANSGYAVYLAYDYYTKEIAMKMGTTGTWARVVTDQNFAEILADMGGGN